MKTLIATTAIILATSTVSFAESLIAGDGPLKTVVSVTESKATVVGDEIRLAGRDKARLYSANGSVEIDAETTVGIYSDDKITIEAEGFLDVDAKWADVNTKGTLHLESESKAIIAGDDKTQVGNGHTTRTDIWGDKVEFHADEVTIRKTDSEGQVVVSEVATVADVTELENAVIDTLVTVGTFVVEEFDAVNSDINDANDRIDSNEDNIESLVVAQAQIDLDQSEVIASNAANIVTVASALQDTIVQSQTVLEGNKQELLDAVAKGDYKAVELISASSVKLQEAIDAAHVELELINEAQDKAIANNTAVISSNSSAISSNAASISSNAANIESNSALIANNSARIDAVSAQSAAALNALASAPSNGVGVAIGNAGGSTAVAIGVKKQLSDRWNFTASVSSTSGQATQFGIGFGFSF